jgi:hypothetical protein
VSEKEREDISRELRERFTPGARTITPQGLSSLANERIEDAMARGQFRNIPRGKGKSVERDHIADSPFVDTTEYLMNRIIKKQDIAPPWIEKQQEVAREVDRFRRRLRSEWRRHAARLIASQGGSLQMQIRRAEAYAAAETRQSSTDRDSDRKKRRGPTDESRTQIDHEGRLSQAVPSLSFHEPPSDGKGSQTERDKLGSEANCYTQPFDAIPTLPPLRDPDYLSIESAYHNLSIKTLNDLTRSYNLLAPQVTQKPYLSLDRELASCYADVAPSLPAEIERRAAEKVHGVDHVTPDKGKNGGVLQALTVGRSARVYDEDTSRVYGFREFWRDMWNRKEEKEFGLPNIENKK